MCALGAPSPAASSRSWLGGGRWTAGSGSRPCLPSSGRWSARCSVSCMSTGDCRLKPGKTVSAGEACRRGGRPHGADRGAEGGGGRGSVAGGGPGLGARPGGGGGVGGGPGVVCGGGSFGLLATGLQ